jgi:2,5-diamino-6-(ribosylamino)-4(3H)-pyrimidinone 5'-phosphate reductase
MKRPKVIIHSLISLDGSVKNMPIEMEMYYSIAISYSADIGIVGSTTVKEAHTDIPKEMPSDFKRRELMKKDKRPYWLILDSKGTCQNLLHLYRRMEYIKDIIVAVSENTPASYLDYLKERDYEVIICGKDKVDLKGLMQILYKKYNSRKVITDSGGALNCALLEEGLVDELSILLSPIIVGNEQSVPLFRTLDIKKNINLELLETKTMEKGHVHLKYKVKGT